MIKILIVNDVGIVNKIIKNKLEAEGGFSVDTALTGREGVTRAQENTYNIILLDYHLPDINGDDVCAAIKSGGKNSNVPICFISSMDKNSMADVIQKTGAQGHLDMTMDITEMASKIRAIAG